MKCLADVFLGWAYDGFADDPAGHARYEWMATWRRGLNRHRNPLN